MNLIIKNPDGLDLTNFCNWLISIMQEYMSKNIEEKKLVQWDNYLNNIIKLKSTDNITRAISSKNILVASTYNLIVKKSNSQYEIALDPNTNIPNYYAKFIDIIKLINYGNINTQPYPIYDYMMDFMADKLIDYYQIYNELEEGK